MPYSALPEPMLARSGRLPISGAYAYEVKWAMVSTEGPLRVRSRRGWSMTDRVGFDDEGQQKAKASHFTPRIRRASRSLSKSSG
jgi:hypothetical protein